MSKWLALVGLILLTLAGAPGNATGALSLEEALERAETAPDELTIRNLTTIIESGEIEGRQLAWALNQRGFRHYMNGALKKALRDFDRALEIVPGYASALGNRGSTLFEMGAHGRARADFELLARLQPENAEAHYNLGRAYSELGFPVQAAEAFGEAIRLVPDFAWAYHNRGLAYARIGQHWKAIADFEEALRLDPGDPDSLHAKGASLQEVGRHGEAAEVLSRVIQAQPGNLAAYRNRGFARCRMGEVEGAVLDHITWIASRPGFVRTTEKALNRLGFEPGPVDGNLDAESRAAMRQWVAAGCP